jgi:hypothetical protein
VRAVDSVLSRVDAIERFPFVRGVEHGRVAAMTGGEGEAFSETACDDVRHVTGRKAGQRSEYETAVGCTGVHAVQEHYM